MSNQLFIFIPARFFNTSRLSIHRTFDQMLSDIQGHILLPIHGSPTADLGRSRRREEVDGGLGDLGLRVAGSGLKFRDDSLITFCFQMWRHFRFQIVRSRFKRGQVNPKICRSCEKFSAVWMAVKVEFLIAKFSLKRKILAPIIRTFSKWVNCSASANLEVNLFRMDLTMSSTVEKQTSIFGSTDSYERRENKIFPWND